MITNEEMTELARTITDAYVANGYADCIELYVFRDGMWKYARAVVKHTQYTRVRETISSNRMVAVALKLRYTRVRETISSNRMVAVALKLRCYCNSDQTVDDVIIWTDKNHPRYMELLLELL